MTGISLPVHFSSGDDCEEFLVKIKTFVKNTGAEAPALISLPIPSSALVLACLKRASPLPSEFWREPIIAKIEAQSNTSNGKKSVSKRAKKP